MSIGATVPVDGMVDADIVAKLLKCHAINFRQIDQTNGVEWIRHSLLRQPCIRRANVKSKTPLVSNIGYGGMLIAGSAAFFSSLQLPENDRFFSSWPGLSRP